MSAKDTKKQSGSQHEEAVYNVINDDAVVSVVATSITEAVKLAQEQSKNEETKQ